MILDILSTQTGLNWDLCPRLEAPRRVQAPPPPCSCPQRWCLEPCRCGNRERRASAASASSSWRKPFCKTCTPSCTECDTAGCARSRRPSGRSSVSSGDTWGSSRRGGGHCGRWRFACNKGFHSCSKFFSSWSQSCDCQDGSLTTLVVGGSPLTGAPAR